jgi:hypothetical protein
MLPILSVLFQPDPGPPDTIPYLILGYVIMGGIGLAYVLSLVFRQRRLKRDLDMLERLASDEG